MTAYELAGYVADNGYIGTGTTHKVATMLRQQADRIAELEGKLEIIRSRKDLLNFILDRRPLTEKEILEVWGDYKGDDRRPFVNFARAIEERHGIK